MESPHIKQFVEDIRREYREEIHAELQKVFADLNRGLDRLGALVPHDPITPVKTKTVKAKAPAQRRKRSATVATEEQIVTVQAQFDAWPESVMSVKKVKDDLKRAGNELGEKQTTVAAACQALAARQVIEPVGRKGYRLVQADQQQQVNGEQQESNTQPSE